MTRHFFTSRGIVTAALLCLFPAAIFAQNNGGPRMDHENTLPPTPTGPTPKTADGHPDLTGLWNGLAGQLFGVPKPMHNVAIQHWAGTPRDLPTPPPNRPWPLQSAA